MQGSYAYTDALKAVHYGPGSVETALPKLLNQFQLKRVLIVTGKSLYTKTNVVKKIESILKKHDAHIGTFYEIGQHAPVAGINSGVQTLLDNNADGVLSLGGGSPIDASKAMIYRHHEQRPQSNYLIHIAVPTTLSAAEYSIGAGYTNEDGHKVAVSGPWLAPSGIILDANLTLSTPEQLWLSTGIRALDHAVESLYRPLVPYPLKVLCFAAIADLFKYLPLSKANPEDTAIRQRLQVSSWMSLWPLKLEKYSALGLSHSLGHKLGATYGIPHGITSCLTLAPTVALQATIASGEDKETLAQALFYLGTASTGSVEQDVRLLSSMIQSLVDQLGLKSSLKEYNVPEGDVPTIATRTLGDPEHEHFASVVELLKSIY